MKLKLSFVVIFLIAFNFNSRAQLLQWNTFGNLGTETTEPSVANDANVAAASMTLGAGVTAAANGNRFGGSNWWNTGNSTNNTLAEAVAGNDYIQFTVTPNTGYSFTPTSFVFYWDRSSSGPSSVTLRSSVDGYTADLGTVTGMVSGGAATTTARTITITGLTNITTATTFRIYGYGATATTGTGGFDSSSSFNNVVLNGTTASSGITTAQNGPWNVGSTWTGGVVPTSAQNAVINHIVTLDVAVTRDSGTTTTVNTGAKLATGAFTYTNNGTTTIDGTFEMNGGGFANGTNLVYGTASTLNFNTGGTYNVANTHTYWPAASSPKNVNIASGTTVVMALDANRTISTGGILSIAGGLTLTTNPTITVNGTLRLDAGGYLNTGAMPIYGSGSTLLYNTGGTYGRGFEWNAAGVGTVGTTPGYPFHVQLSNSTALNYINGAASGAVGSKAIGGNLTIDAGSALYMDYGSVSAGGELVVAGNLSNAGTITLGAAVGDDLRVTGNLTNTGTFTGNNRAVFFNKAGTQVVTSAAGITIPYLRTAGTATVVQLAAGTNLTVSAPLAGNAIIFGSASDVIDINGNTLTIGTAAVANTISGTGTFKGSTTSNMTLLGNGSVGTIYFTGGSQNLGTFVMNRQNGLTGCVMGTAVTINTALTLTAGLIDLNNTTMTVASAVTMPAGSANSYVIADVSAGGVLRKNITATGSQTFPIGSGGTEFSPATVNLTAATLSGAYLGMAVENSKDPLMDATSIYLNRYWVLPSSGVTAPTYTFTGTYLAGDVVGGTVGNNSNQHNGTTWLNNGATIAGTVIINGTTLSGSDHYTSGRRDPEINIVQVATNYLNGSTYNFGTVLTGSTVDVVFTIQNLGQQTLLLVATPTITGNPPYSLQANYASNSVTGISGSTPGTQTFTIRFAPTAAGTFTGSVSIANNDPSGAENPYVINFTGVGQVPTPDINIKGFTGGTNNITNGNITTTSGLENTAFGSVNLGSNLTKDYEIQNTGTATLTLTGAPIVSIGGTNPGDFVVTTVPASSSLAVSTSTTFIITFTPQAVGPRSAIVSVASNDPDENPYTYLINGTGVCLATANTITPTSGPVGTEVTITATTNNLTGATVSFNGTNATPVTQVSTTVIKVTVPSGASTGNLVTTNSQGCTATNAFTVLTNLAQPCQGGYIPTDLFISEFTDSNSGALSYVEIYNGTGVTKNLANYSLKTANNGGAYSFTLNLSNVNLASGSTYVVALGDDDNCSVAGGDGSYAAQTSGGGSVNFTASGHDHVALFNGVTHIDSWGTFGSNTWASALSISTEGADFRRNTTAIAPNTTYSNSDWTVIDYAGSGTSFCANNDYSNIGTYSMPLGVAPSVTLHPAYTPTCRLTTLTVAGSEGYTLPDDTMDLTYQWYAVAPNTAAWSALSNGALYSGVSTATLTISDISTLIGYQFYCQVRENAATCYAASNAVMIIAGQSTTWQAANTWSNGVPTLDTAVIIDNTYDTANAYSPSFNACSVTVNTTKNVIVRGNDYIQIKNGLTVSGTGTATFENNSSLVQINNVANSGNITYKRIAQQRAVDYVYWSSPVNGYSLATLPSDGYKFSWNTTLNNGNGTQGNWEFYSGSMDAGKGYISGGPSSFSNTANQNFEVPFLGVPRNGDVSVTVNRGSYQGANYTLATGALVTNLDDNWNLLGNPYPSSISCRGFLSANSSVLTGALYIWTHGTLPSTATLDPFYDDFISNYDPNADYLPFNLTGNLANPNPDFYIGAGQGFFVVMQDGAAGSGTVNFTNALRNISYGNATGTNFYRMMNNTTTAEVQAPELNRIWLDIIKEGVQKPVRTMFGYVDGATMGRDNLYDAITKNDQTLKVYTIINNDKFVIQGRSLPFNEYDQVPLGVDIVENGNYKIAVGIVDGLFTNTDQKIYLEDKFLGIIHDLRQAPYQFTSTTGTFDDRFVIRYTTETLGNPDFESLDNSVTVASNHGELNIKSTIENIAEVTVFDVLGRQLFHSKAIGEMNFAVTNISLSQQSLIVKIKLEGGTVITRKTIVN